MSNINRTYRYGPNGDDPMAGLNYGQVGSQTLSDGSPGPMRIGRSGEQIFTELHGRYYQQAKNGKVFMAQAIVTAPVIFSTAAGTGGPLLWNPPTSGVDAVILGVSFGVTVVTTVAAALGITGNSGQSVAPGSTTAIDGRSSGYIGGGNSACTAYRVGTPTNAGGFLLPFASLHTGALTVDTGATGFADIGGMVIVPPGSWASIAASATATTTVAQLGMIWEEVPV
jgi:hypothetical protein